MKIKHFLVAIVLAGFPSFVSAQLLPYQNHELSAEERAEDLCKRLTLEEKSLLMMNGSPAIERLGIPSFDWWSEALHGVGRNGLATVFPSCIGMAASFDDDLIEEVFTAVSDEARAKNTLARREGKNGKYKGLSFWTPNINVFRDPRWGRGQETYGEDPYMNGRMGLRVVKGLQGDGTGKYYKLHACAKHYAVHSGPEKTRHSFDIERLPARELWETYLPAFKMLVKDGKVQQVMCAYQRFEGSPCCGSDRLLNSILRYDWGFDGLVVSDCGAIGDFYREGRHEVSKDAKAASALGVLSGTDVECGGVYKNLPGAVKRGDVKESDIDVCVKRLLKGRFELGDFDPDSIVPWTSIPMSVVSSVKHRELARKMAREQMVLLKNNGILPLSPDAANIMVMGPNAADSTMMWGIYYGQPAHTVTALEGLNARTGRKLPYTRACAVTRMTDQESVFGNFHCSKGKGMEASYWNNTGMSGQPDVEVVYTSAISLDNGGNTAFAPGVNLTNFTTRIKGTYIADRDEILRMVYNNDDGLRIIINGDTVHNRWKTDPLNFRDREFAVEKGKKYDIEVDYMQLEDDATLNFDILRSRDVTPADAVANAKDAEIVIFIGGISPAYEREEAKVNEPGFDNGDRTSIELPEPQREILKALHAAGKKIVFVNCSGSAVALTPENDICDAILQAWYPGEQGGHAIADVIFGDYNPSGKLPVTFYKKDSQLPAFDDYLMEGRTYRYMREAPLYQFGYGLSYTRFDISKPVYSNDKIKVRVKNTGKVAGTEVVQVYMRRPADADGPNKTLRGYARVTLAPGESRDVVIDFPKHLFENWDEKEQEMRVVPGEYELMVGSSSADRDLKRIKVKI
ncbi:xylan 1,4-beta-xylosidase [Duncaniella freteri]|uniref:xylan 1,4-beta-xylosidase n=5 Tax=Duncaniella TaxID=2518495 RepID=UPI00136FB127|nr:xylan 1,4-beta-xylosidase [Duncaniella freteri]NBJ08410.1 glycoside hydrolase family 3 protein [Alistipes sp. Z76]NCE70416.1 glycoside hydrolase family 3 protein [Muribaculaceae bacterium M3]